MKAKANITSLRLIMVFGISITTIMFASRALNADWKATKISSSNRQPFHTIIDVKNVKPLNERTTSQIINPAIHVDVQNIGRLYDVDLRILILTYKRPHSLHRLLLSLNAVDYMNDTVCLEIWIDRSRQGQIDEETFKCASQFKFKQFHVLVVNHTRHVGLYGQWMGTWQPTRLSTEIAVIFEDDVTVSPFFYRYLKHVHNKYDQYSQVNGYSLGCIPKHANGSKGNIHTQKEEAVFTTPILGTQGFSPKKDNWINFTNWYKTVYRNNDFQPFVPGINPTKWYKGFMKTGIADTMWSMWHIYYAWKHDEVTMLPGLQNCNGFSIHWREKGLHAPKTFPQHDHVIVKWDKKYENLPKKPIHISTNGMEMESIL